MARGRKLQNGITLFAQIERADSDFLRAVARNEYRPVAEIVREAIAVYRKKRARETVRMCRRSVHELEKIRPALMRAAGRSKKPRN